MYDLTVVTRNVPHHEPTGVAVLNSLDIAGLSRLGLELTLRLADGRALDFHILREDGTIHSTARGLYTPD
jgi:hypothetical protein